MHNKNNTKGVITLEACICVLSFLVLMLLLSSLFVLFMAQNATAHAVLQTSESLSLDAYQSTHLQGGYGSVSEVLVSLGEWIGEKIGMADDPNFVSKTDITALENDELTDVLQTRFIAYLAGGDEKVADNKLKQMNVVDGVNGLDFSGSYVQDDTLYIVLQYQLEYDFNIWNVGKIDVEQTACSRLWK